MTMTDEDLLSRLQRLEAENTRLQARLVELEARQRRIGIRGGAGQVGA